MITNDKPQDGTMNATGTNNANVDFDARKANKGIFADFDRAVSTINRYLTSKNVGGKAYGFKYENEKEAHIIVLLTKKADFEKVEHEIRAQLAMRREQMTAYNVTLYLTFDTEKDDILSDEVLEFD
jgi:hypothetical protein